MTKLKTLKDIAGNGILANNDFVLDYDEDGEGRGYILYNDPVPILRAEAIKWIKRLDDAYEDDGLGETSFCASCGDWINKNQMVMHRKHYVLSAEDCESVNLFIKYFFNIAKEDLK